MKMSEEDFKKIGASLPEVYGAALASSIITRAAMEKEILKAQAEIMRPKMKSYHERAFSIVAKYDSHNDLFWWADFKVVGVMCSDFFSYATADLEEITSDEDADALEQAYKDVQKVSEHEFYICWAPELYAARKRKLKPASFIRIENDKIRALFDAIDGKQLE